MLSRRGLQAVLTSWTIQSTSSIVGFDTFIKTEWMTCVDFVAHIRCGVCSQKHVVLPKGFIAAEVYGCVMFSGGMLRDGFMAAWVEQAVYLLENCVSCRVVFSKATSFPYDY